MTAVYNNTIVQSGCFKKKLISTNKSKLDGYHLMIWTVNDLCATVCEMSIGQIIHMQTKKVFHVRCLEKSMVVGGVASGYPMRGCLFCLSLFLFLLMMDKAITISV